MSDQTPYPPPGSPPPGSTPAAAPGADPTWASVPPGQVPYPGPPTGAPGRPPVPFGAAHRPGAVPLRPLGLGDVYDGAFRILRINVRATVGAAASVGAIAMAIPIVVTAIATATGGASIESSTSSGDTGGAVSLISYGVGRLLLQIALVLVTGMVAGVARQAAIGRTTSLGEAWAGTRGRRARLVGLLLLQLLMLYASIAVFVVVGVVVVVASGSVGLSLLWFLGVGVLGMIPLLAFLYVRLFLLSTPALMLEGTGVLASMGRARALSKGQFWRLWGISILTALMLGVAGFVIGIPFSIVGAIGRVASDQYGALIYIVAVALGSVVSSAFVAPLQGTAISLLYLDQRMRKEGYEVELMTEAGLLDR